MILYVCSYPDRYHFYLGNSIFRFFTSLFDIPCSIFNIQIFFGSGLSRLGRSESGMKLSRVFMKICLDNSSYLFGDIIGIFFFQIIENKRWRNNYFNDGRLY